MLGVSLSNVSVHKFAPWPKSRPTPKSPTEQELINLEYLTPDGHISPNHTFLVFYMGDYDVIHTSHSLMANYHARHPWLDEKRGDIPLAWGFNPGMVEEIPAMMTYFYSTQTNNDYFVGANTGAGYVNPDGLSRIAFLRWLGRSKYYYSRYGYDIMGFLLNGDGAMMSQKRISAFTYITPKGILSLDIQTDEPYPRFQNDTPLAAIGIDALGGSPDSSAELIHRIYLKNMSEGRPPFLAFRSTFLSTNFVWHVRERLNVHDAEGRIIDENGEVIHPNYTVVDPYTFFALLERWLETN